MQLSITKNNTAIDISEAIQRKIIRVLHRVPNMTDLDSMVYFIYLVNRRLLKIL